VTESPETAAIALSSTVAVAVEVEVPLATMLVGDNDKVIVAPVPAAWAVPASRHKPTIPARKQILRPLRRDITTTTHLDTASKPPLSA
jgi:hypothetical protein